MQSRRTGRSRRGTHRLTGKVLVAVPTAMLIALTVSVVAAPSVTEPVTAVVGSAADLASTSTIATPTTTVPALTTTVSEVPTAVEVPTTTTVPTTTVLEAPVSTVTTVPTTTVPTTTVPTPTVPEAPVSTVTTVPTPTVPAPTATEDPVAETPTGFNGSLVLDGSGDPVNGQSNGVLVTPKGWVLPILATDDSGWTVWTRCARTAKVTEGKVIQKVDFVLDPGHGGSETGAVGKGRLREADLNFEVTKRIKKGLEKAGYSVVMTRHGNVRVPIVTRGEIARALNPKAFISVHFNGSRTNPRSKTPGTEMYHQIKSSDSKRLAGLLYEETTRALEQYDDVSWVAHKRLAGIIARPNKQGIDYYGVLRRPAPVTSVLVEFGYLTNPAEAKLYANPDVQNELAAAAARAINRFAESEKHGDPIKEIRSPRYDSGSGTGTTKRCIDPKLQ